MRGLSEFGITWLTLWLALATTGPAQTPLLSPKVNKRTLLNGISILAVEQHQAPTVSVQLMIKSGATYDPMNKGGLADMTAEMLKAGTQQRSRQQIARELEGLGLTIRTQVNWDATYIIGQGPAKQVGRILDLIANLVINPAFPEPEFNQFKALRIDTLKQQREDPSSLADQVFIQKLFERTTYGRPLLGTPQTIERIKLGDIKEFYEKFYLPNNAILIVVGDVDPVNVIRLAGRKIGSWVKGDVPPFTFLPPQAPGATKIYLIDKPEITQAQVRVGHLGIARENDDYFPVRLLSQIFSESGENSRLQSRLRAKTSYKGPLEVRLETRRMAGPFIVALSPATEQVAPVVSETIAAIRQMKEGITPKELENAKQALVSQYAAQTQTPEQLAARLLELDLYQLGPNYISLYQERVERVALEDLRRVAERYFDPGGQIVVVVGNAAALKAPLQALGSVTVLSGSAID